MSKYASVIFPDDKKKNAEAKNDAVENAQNEVVNAVFGAKRALSTAKKDEKRAMSAVPFSPAEALQASRSVSNCQQDLDDLEAMQTAMF